MSTRVERQQTRKFKCEEYISKEFSELLLTQGIQLVTRIKKNMENKLMPLWDKLLLRKRAVIETVNNPSDFFPNPAFCSTARRTSFEARSL